MPLSTGVGHERGQGPEQQRLGRGPGWGYGRERLGQQVQGMRDGA